MVHLTIVRKMCESLNYSQTLKTVFGKCVESVKPKSLLNSQKIELVLPNSIRIGDECIDIKGRKCHLVGFGKAVLGMAVQMERVLGDTLVSGMLSVPVGTAARFASDQDMQLHRKSVIKVYEGARNNLPDPDAEATAKRIYEYAERLTEEDVLFVLISGGGSSLLPIPSHPLTLNEKIDVIRRLASSGATINELNIVRIKMSSIKGGKLAIAARNAHQIVSLIISDICGDPINLIASGPTFIQNIEGETAKQILQKYNLLSTVPDSVLKCLTSSSSSTSSIRSDMDDFVQKSLVQVIGNNSVAISVAIEEMNKLQIRGFCMSKVIEGDVAVLSSIYCKIAEAVYELDSGRIDQGSFQNLIYSLDETIKLEKDFCNRIINAVLNRTNRTPICIVSGGETTVTVTGSGIGGRNQELALRIASEIEKNETIGDIIFLSAGTDGIDGPCDAAGAVASLQMANDCRQMQNGSIEASIENNDSYNLYRQVCDGMYHIITGHTGTNVMDLHFMMIPLKPL